MKKFLLLLLLSSIASADTYTTHYNLQKPYDGSDDWGAAIRDDLDTIDTQMFVNESSIDDHIADTSGAHAATAITASSGAAVCTSSTTVQTFLACLDTSVNALTPGGGVDIGSTQTITGAKTFTALVTTTSGIKSSNLSTGIVHSDADGDFSSTLITNTDINSSAAIDRTKIASGTADHVLINNGSGVMSSEAQLAGTRGGTGVSSTATFPASGVVTTDAGTSTLTNKTISGASNTITNVSLTAGVTGVLPNANGGTNQSTYASGDILYASAANTLSKLAKGSDSQRLKLVSGLPAWAHEAVTAAQTTTYAIAATDELVLLDATGGAFTATLPTAATAGAGKVIKARKIDTNNSYLTGVITIARASSDTIEESSSATSTTINTTGETLTLQSDGTSKWYVIDRVRPSIFVGYTPTFTGFGTVSGVEFYSRRVGDSLEVVGRFTAGTTTATEARITLGFAGTDGNVISAGSDRISTIRMVGPLAFGFNGAFSGHALMEQSTAYLTLGIQSGSTNSLTKISASSAFSTGNVTSVTAMVPITGWK